MQVSVETTSGLERKLTVQVPADRIEGEVTSRLKDLARRVKIDGFRPGKVPISVVKKRYDGSVRQEVVGEILKSTFQEAITQENLRLVGEPKIDAKELQPGQGLEYIATFDVYPEIQLADLGQIAVEKPVANIEDSDVDQMFEKLRQQRVTWAQVDRAAQDKDQIVIDFEGSIDGQLFDGGSGSKVNLVLGSKAMIDGFEDQLLKAGAGDHRSLNVTFPDDYNSKDLAGKDAVFEVDIISVSEPVLPEIDDEFAKGFGVEGGLETFRGEVRNTMERELAQAIRAKVKNDVMDALLEANKIDIPKSFVEDEITRLQEQMQQQMQASDNQAQGSDADLPRSFFEEQAQKRVSLSLLIAEFAKSNAVQIDEEKVRSTIENMASSYEQPDQVIQHYYQDPSLMESVRGLVMEELVVDRLLESVNVIEKSTTFDAVMNHKQA